MFIGNIQEIGESRSRAKENGFVAHSNYILKR